MKTPLLKLWVVPTLIVLTLAAPAFAQTPTNQISANEARDARQLARRFSQRLQRTKDITPLIDDYFVSNFLDGYLQDKDENWFLFLQRSVATQVSGAELRRYYIAEVNWFYLIDLYVFSKYSSLSDRETTPEQVLPADLLALFRSDPTLKATIDDVNYEESSFVIGSVERFRKFLPKLETANRLLTKHARRMGAGRTRQYRETLSDWAFRYDHFEPRLSVCEERCLTLDKGTRLMTINVPSLQLQLAKVRGQMQIVGAKYFFAGD